MFKADPEWQNEKKQSEVISTSLAEPLAQWLIDEVEAGAGWSKLDGCRNTQLLVNRLEAALQTSGGYGAIAIRVRKVVRTHFDFEFWKFTVKPLFYEYRRASRVVRLRDGVYQELVSFKEENQFDSMSEAIDELLYKHFKKSSECDESE